MKNKRQIMTIVLSVLSTLVVVCAVVFCVKLFKNSLIESGYSKTPNSANQYAKDVTMVQLIATPDKYDGELVRVIGIGNLEFEGNCISLSKEDLKYGIGNSIWIELGERAISYEEAQKYNGEYVIIEGIFDKDDCGHMDMFCGSIKSINRYELWDVHKYYTALDMYSITKNNDLTYTYKVVDKNGNVLFSKDNATREPNVEPVNTHILGIIVQAGTGLSTNWAVYCDIENSKVSETFQYVLMAQGNYVIYANYENGEHSVIVQNIFDKSLYYKKHILANCSPVAGDIVIGAKPNGEGIAVVTYLTGNDYKETELTIRFPSSIQNPHLPYAYDTIINNIINAYPWNNDDINMIPENPELSYMYRQNSKLSEIGFALIDLDGNGQEELIISDPSKFVYDLYTISNGKAVHLFDSGERYCYILRENGIVENTWSGSAVTNGHDFYKLNGEKLYFIERITLDAYHALNVGVIDDLSEANDYNCFFRSSSEDEKDYKSVTSDEAIKAIEHYQNANKPLTIEYTFLSEYQP